MSFKRKPKNTPKAYFLALRNEAMKESIRNQAHIMRIPMTEWVVRSLSLMEKYINDPNGVELIEPKEIKAYKVEEPPRHDCFPDLVKVCALALQADPSIAPTVSRLLSK